MGNILFHTQDENIVTSLVEFPFANHDDFVNNFENIIFLNNKLYSTLPGREQPPLEIETSSIAISLS